MEFAKQYYGCDDIEGVFLENEGGFGTARFVNNKLVLWQLIIICFFGIF